MARPLNRGRWERAEDLAIRKGMTLDSIAEDTGISLAALKKRSSRDRWVFRRKSYMRLGEKCYLQAEKLIEEMLEEGTSPAKVDGVQKLIKAYTDLQRVEGPDETMLFPELWRKILLVVRELDPEGAAVLARHEAEILQRLTAREEGRRVSDAQVEPRKGLSPEMADEIRKKVLGAS